jgi:type IV secretory pathway VirB10-like protein
MTMSQDETPDVPIPDAAPKVAPENVALRAQPRPVTRLNRRTLALLTGGLGVAVLGATVWSLQPTHRRGGNEPAELYNVDRVSRSEGLDQLPTDYSKLPAKVPELGPPLPGDLGPAIVKSQQPMEMRPPHGGTGGIDPAQAERLAAEEAARSSVFFRAVGNSGGGTRPGVGAVAPVQPAAGSVAALPPSQQAFNPMGSMPTASSTSVDPTAAQNRQDAKEAFLAKAGDGATRNPGSLQLPASPYQVMAGTVIAGALVTGIQSDLPGDVIATVTEPVYDTATGKFLLIPQGSRILGKYNSQVSYGQSRVQVVWSRIILPDTSSITLDQLGRAPTRPDVPGWRMVSIGTGIGSSREPL